MHQNGTENTEIPLTLLQQCNTSTLTEKNRLNRMEKIK